MTLYYYLVKNILLTILTVTGVIALIDFIMGSVMQLGVVGMHGSYYYSFWDALIYVALRLPSDVTVFFPISAFLGTLFALHHLVTTSELTAMRSAGYSLFDFSKALGGAALVLICFYYALGLYLAPMALHASYLKRNFNSGNTSVLVLANATWLRVGQHVLYISQILPDGVLFHVTDYRIDNGQLDHIRQIDKAKITGDNWQLTHVVETTLTDEKVTTQTLPTLTEPTLIVTTILPAITMDMDEMSESVLYDYIHYRQHNHLDTRTYEVKFWGRLFQPIALLIMMLIALPLFFGPPRNGGINFRFMGGLGLGFVFYVINQFLSNVTAVIHLSPFLAALLPSLIFVMIGVILVKRLN